MAKQKLIHLYLFIYTDAFLSRQLLGRFKRRFICQTTIFVVLYISPLIRFNSLLRGSYVSASHNKIHHQQTAKIWNLVSIIFATHFRVTQCFTIINRT